jgi:uncharacterized protein YeaO (DUF488 family)
MLKLKRAYEAASTQDGKRYLVERLWPRGIKKTELRLDGWLKEAAPSSALRTWFGHDPAKWDEFCLRYFKELDERLQALAPILDASQKGNVTLIFSSHDTEHNNAVALKHYLEAHFATTTKPIHRKRPAA